MNYFAHALPFLDDPYFVAGTAVPDWLAVVDRQVRVRARNVEPLRDDVEPRVVALSRGILQHFRDDAQFHGTRAFAETMFSLTGLVRDALGAESGFRPSFLGHLLVEVLLDASLVAEFPQQVEVYYRAIDAVDSRLIQDTVNRVAARPTDRLALLIPRFSAERILSDYGQDAKLMVRLNQVMRRVKLAPLPDDFAAVLPPGRRLVAERKNELLDGIPVGEGSSIDHRLEEGPSRP
jgi:hypothetical protein